MNPNVAYAADERVAVTSQGLGQWTAERLAGSLLAYGPCPECTHTAQVPILNEIATNAAAAVDGVPPDRRTTRKFSCTCPQDHLGRPPEIAGGCGRWWLATMIRDGDGWTFIQADEGLLPALTALDQAAADEVSAVRTSAEKWLPGVTALYGLFGLAGVVVGKDAVKDLPALGRAALVLVIASGLACAVYAVLSGYRAAYGWLDVKDVSTDDKLQEWYRQRRMSILAAPEQLARALRSAVAALVLLLVALGLIWLWPAASPSAPRIKVSYRQDGDVSQPAFACGQLTGLDGRQVRLRVDTTTRGETVAVPAGWIDKIEPVRACT